MIVDRRRVLNSRPVMPESKSSKHRTALQKRQNHQVVDREHFYLPIIKVHEKSKSNKTSSILKKGGIGTYQPQPGLIKTVRSLLLEITLKFF